MIFVLLPVELFVSN